MSSASKAPREVRGIRSFRVTDVTYHRNGISGRAFYSVRFSYEDDMYTPPKFNSNMLAVVPREARLEGPDVEIYVVDLNHPTENWRGENFIPFIQHAIIDDNEERREEFSKALKPKGDQ